jgi:hypothetical protein
MSAICNEDGDLAIQDARRSVQLNSGAADLGASDGFQGSKMWGIVTSCLVRRVLLGSDRA